jgi:hypothetical protein
MAGQPVAFKHALAGMCNLAGVGGSDGNIGSRVVVLQVAAGWRQSEPELAPCV